MPFSIRESLSFAWRTTKSNFWFLLGMLVITYAINFGIALIAEVLGRTSPFLGVLGNIAGTAVSLILSLGVISIMLHLYAGNRPGYKELFRKAHLFWKILFASILYGLMIIGGFILLIVPGIYLAIRFGFFQYVIVDHEMGPIAALKESSRLTVGAKWQILWLSLILVGINILGALALLIGLLFTVPMTFLATVYVYKTLHARLAPVASAPAAEGADAV